MGWHMRERIAALLAGAGMALMPAMAWGQGYFTDPMVPFAPLPLGPGIIAPPAAQQFLPLGMSVTDRLRPEINPLGICFGDFFFFPRAELGEYYDDNIFATTTGRTGAFITELQPGFDIRSNLPQNAINLSAGGAFTRYDTHTSLNTDDGYGDLNGRLDVDNQHYFSADVRAEQNHINIGAPEVPGNAAAPLRFNDYNGTVAFDQYRLRIGYEISGTVRREEYNALPLVGGGFTPESNLNNFAYEGALRTYYEFMPGYQAYIRAAYNQRDYDHAEGFGIPILSSSGYRIDVGSRINLTNVTYLDLFVGYLDQNYEASQFGSIGGIDFGANVVWNATQLTTVKFQTGRTVEDINSAVLGVGTGFNSPGYLETTVGASVDHELLRHLLLNGNVAYTNDAFQNITRTDNIYSIGAGAKYLMTRNLYLGGSYTFEKVELDRPGSDVPLHQQHLPAAAQHPALRPVSVGRRYPRSGRCRPRRDSCRTAPR